MDGNSFESVLEEATWLTMEMDGRKRVVVWWQHHPSKARPIDMVKPAAIGQWRSIVQSKDPPAGRPESMTSLKRYPHCLRPQ